MHGAREELPSRACCYHGQAWAGSRMGWAGGCASGCSSLGACAPGLSPGQVTLLWDAVQMATRTRTTGGGHKL